jgi:hypothetical protein
MLARRFTYVVDDVEEGHIAWQRNDVRLADTEKHLLLKGILGELKPFTEKEYANTLLVYSNTHAKLFGSGC